MVSLNDDAKYLEEFAEESVLVCFCVLKSVHFFYLWLLSFIVVHLIL
jgi:hypothetical protein